MDSGRACRGSTLRVVVGDAVIASPWEWRAGLLPRICSACPARILVDIKPGNEPAIMLAAVLAIEWLCEESNWPYWLSR